MALFLLWATSYHLLAGMQALNHQSRWLIALSDSAQRQTLVRMALSQTSQRLNTEQPRVESRLFVINRKKLGAGDETLYLLSLYQQSERAGRKNTPFLQFAYGNQARAVWSR